MISTRVLTLGMYILSTCSDKFSLKECVISSRVLTLRICNLSTCSAQVLVKNAVCGVNFLDIYLRKNTLIPMPLPFTMGVEGAGTVEKLGPSVSGLAVGNRVAYVQILSGWLKSVSNFCF